MCKYMQIITISWEERAQILWRVERGIWKCLEGEKKIEKFCNYIIILKVQWSQLFYK